MVEPGSGFIWETWLTQLSGTNWLAANGAEFNLNTNGLRPAGWTSGDAAGFPMFSALVRYDEAERGMVEHACRLVVAQSLYGSYIYPATHYAAPSSNTNANLPAMGQRLRLKAAFVIPDSWTMEEKAVLPGLKCCNKQARYRPLPGTAWQRRPSKARRCQLRGTATLSSACRGSDGYFNL